ncbi:hypothetical protein KR50_33020 [Jeotgalibacillus campisalis]|uniref:Uncharacterized protein n=1 Tax=Jeotgalibacillus campisalis TaxID=220754 RepID=A0A0C2V412_9BACL|nr:hypothetical protein KR50_33020 [Jeotgalibacillus campisalis]
MIWVILIFIFKWDRFISVPGARFIAGRESAPFTPMNL